MRKILFRSSYLTWPVPALLAWGVAWASFVATRVMGAGVLPAWLLAATMGVAGSLLVSTPVRKLWTAAGFPLSWWALTGSTGLGLMADFPAWAWLALLALVLVLYPPGTWRDAPLFPTPHDALAGLGERVPLPLAGYVLDAGCGVGDGLLALERAYPEVHLHGIERSWPLRLICAWRVRQAHVVQGDIWRADWSRYDMVYLFQRPESMPHAWAKACAEFRPGAWLASLEFAVPDVSPTTTWTCPDGRMLWLYQPPNVPRPVTGLAGFVG